MGALKTKIVNIGNSRGIRIPKLLIEQAGFDSEVEISIDRKGLLIRPASRPRAGWEEQFKLMAQRGDDQLVDETSPTHFDESDWQW